MESPPYAQETTSGYKLSVLTPGFVDSLIHAHCLNESGGMATCEKAAAKLPNVVNPPRIQRTTTVLAADHPRLRSGACFR